MKNVIKIAKIANPERFFLASSSEVYGEPVEFPQNELTTPLNSRLPYAVVKNINELYLKSFSKKIILATPFLDSLIHMGHASLQILSYQDSSRWH